MALSFGIGAGQQASVIKILGWLGAVLGPVGAILLALNIQISPFGYVFFLVGSASWVIYAASRRDKPVLVQSLQFTVINVVGLYNWVLVPYLAG